MIDKNKIVKYSGITIVGGLILYGGISITIDEVLLSHEIHPCFLSKIFGIEHRIEKIKEDKDVVDVIYVNKGNTNQEYNVEGPAFIINKEGNMDYYGIDKSYTETKIVKLNDKMDSESVNYIRKMGR